VTGHSIYNAAGEITDVFEIQRVLESDFIPGNGNIDLHGTRGSLDEIAEGECMHGGELRIMVEVKGTDGKVYTVYAMVEAILSDEDAR
jgi:hypothetical protein